MAPFDIKIAIDEFTTLCDETLDEATNDLNGLIDTYYPPIDDDFTDDEFPMDQGDESWLNQCLDAAEERRLARRSKPSTVDTLFNDRAVARHLGSMMRPTDSRIFNYVLNHTPSRKSSIDEATHRIRRETYAANTIQRFYKNNPIDDCYDNILRLVLYNGDEIAEYVDFMIWKYNNGDPRYPPPNRDQLPPLSEKLSLLIEQKPRRGFLQFLKEYNLHTQDLDFVGI